MFNLSFMRKRQAEKLIARLDRAIASPLDSKRKVHHLQVIVLVQMKAKKEAKEIKRGLTLAATLREWYETGIVKFTDGSSARLADYGVNTRFSTT